MRVWFPTDRNAVVIDIVVWAVGSTAVGYALHRTSLNRFETDGWITRIRRWERDGRFWADHVAIRRWKGALPDAGDVFTGGFSKRQLAGRDPAYLRRFMAETRRAELVHWLVPAVAPVFVLWNPPWLVGVMAAYGIAANLPCLLAQRYNRARLQRALSRVSGPRR